MKFFYFLNSLSKTGKVLLLILVLLTINLLQSVSIDYFPEYHDLLRQLYYIPILLTGFLLSSKPAMAFSLIIVLDYNVHMYLHGNLNVYEYIFQSVLFIFFSFISNLMIGKINSLTLKLQKSKMDFYKGLANVLDSRDTYTEGHSVRVANLARLIGQHLNFNNIRLDNLFISALLHDIGKIGIPDSVLKKNGKLSLEEYELIKSHPIIGRTIMRDIEIYDEILKGIYYHHEFFNGNGYPDKIIGNNIPVFARIISIADTFDALTSQRSYNKRKSISDAVDIIASESGKQFDPELVTTFISISKELEKVSELGGAFYLDPVCKMKINPASSFKSCNLENNTYYFCSQQCYDIFIENAKHSHFT